MVLHEDIRVPRAIAPFAVRIQYRVGQTSNVGFGTASAVELDNQDDPRRLTTITIYPAVRGGENNSLQPIPPGATVTVTFPKSAGIANPTEGGAFSWTVATNSKNTDSRFMPNTLMMMF